MSVYELQSALAYFITTTQPAVVANRPWVCPVSAMMEEFVSGMYSEAGQ